TTPPSSHLSPTQPSVHIFLSLFFFLNNPPTTEIYTLSLHDALPISVMSGEVNFSNEIPPKDWAQVTANSDLKGVTLEGSRYNWLLCNTTKKPLDNPKVRQAVAQAIDREAFVKGAFFCPATTTLGGGRPPWD